MICPRCEKDTTLWIQRIGHDEIERGTGKVLLEAPKVFLCDSCKADWSSISSKFKAYWKRSRKMPLLNADYNAMYGLFLKDNDRYGGKIDRDVFAQIAVSMVGAVYGDFTKRETIFIPEADLVTSEDYAWAAGVVDACGKISEQENPGKICLSIRHKDRRILDRVKDLVGGNVNADKKEGGIFVFTTTRKNSEAFIKRVEPYLKCSKKSHPEEVSEDDRTLAWIAGFAQASASNGIITSSCRWAIRLMGTMFPGVETASGEEYSFAPEKEMRERLSCFVLRKLDPAGALGSTAGSNPREVAAFRYARGEGRALRVPKGSQPERPPGPKPNAVAGFNPAGEGSRPSSALAPKPKTDAPPTGPSVWEAPPPAPDLTPEIEVSGDTQVRLSTQAENCVVCKKIYEDLGKDKGILRVGKEVSLRGKIGHLLAEFGISLRSECPACQEEVLLTKWAEDWSMCEECQKEMKEKGREKAAVDDKAWASK